ncbi:hypothetical protein EV673_0778 [Limnobacter thiooxidans]|uniref:Uncharacterized protein n=1 Tax=Limnobacter thiooxidans TaxID=131080 RepID=A0AA86J0W7_9BURK|nr:hypothetical protein EV673_0778 [Limnobacter thiooxidans]BET26123.1 hypothetical protein RGQ30_16240 [Limnobacter thiooxidans]
MTLSILELAGTFGLRETMIISLFDRLISKHRLVKALGLLLCSLFYSAGHGFEIGNPAGLQQIGKRLDLQSNVTGIPEGTESQLRSTCLKARARPAGREGVDAFEGQGNDDLHVDFVPTIRQGGVIQFRSSAAVDDALVELELISDCPLLAFRSSWMLIMEPEQARFARAQANMPEPDGSTAFDLRNSSLLKASRVVPKRATLAVASPIQPEPQVQSTPAHVEQGTPANVETSDSQTIGVEEEPVQLAAIDPGFSEQGLIESRPSQVSPEIALPDEHGALWMGFDPTSPAIWVFLVSMAMLLVVTFAFGKSQLKQFRASKTQVIKVEPSRTSAQVLFKEYSEHPDMDNHVVTDTSEPTPAYTQDRVLESLMGSEGQDSDVSYDSLKPVNNLEVTDTQSRTSLSVCLELINKADIRMWNLPEAYQGLVATRNKSLDLHRTVDALLLRCQVGLVELAFQEARKNRCLPDEVAQELLTVVIGKHEFDLDASPALCVPDVVKSHVRAKMCEISGAEKRTLLQENLVNLNTQVSNPGLCFSSNAWREFLSEEGILE